MIKFYSQSDNASVCLSGTNLNTLIENLNGELSNVSLSFRANGLALTLNKKPVYNFSQQATCIVIGVKVIARVKAIKFLDVPFDSNVTQKTHILSVCRRMFRFLPLVRKCKIVFDLFTPKIVYNELVYPSLIYCITAWGNAANTHLNLSVFLQTCIIRRMFKVDSSFHTAPLFKNLNVLPVKD